ncbi:hypothetical protein OVA24_13640 [Luteolibacter sp. SL250]|uniref:hypothetical protein n=1 Tax=Luteolibacter sp. SL250 TaxID=2995170 RepID=UPI00227030A3|nr:hypothetical protein [Luteolibacter sp. SL250]WAC18278.1 hypothetical protein OVA24_13640 [Luteolibacter sp. SL250]
MKNPFPPCLWLALTAVFLPSTAQAVLVFASDFNTTPDPTPGFANNPVGGNTAGYTDTSPNGTRAIMISDVSTSNGGSAVLDMDALPAFSTALPGQNELRISADFAVTSLGSAAQNTNSLPRMLLRSTATNGDTVTAQTLTLGFGRNASDTLILYAARSENAAPNHSSAVVLAEFGTYSATAADNDTDYSFISFVISYTQGSSQFNISAFNGLNLIGSGTVTGFSSSLTFTQTTTAFLAAVGNTSTSVLYLDNVRVETVPEPTAAALASLALIGLVHRRRRR